MRDYWLSKLCFDLQDPARVAEYLHGLQESIVARMQALDGKAFIRDDWKRTEGGGGSG